VLKLANSNGVPVVLVETTRADGHMNQIPFNAIIIGMGQLSAIRPVNSWVH
jgi:hypothetical protein